jgi:trans-aconitate methyltransferase
VERLEKRYRDHHRERRSPDFVYGGAERASLFRELVGGPGQRVLDLGCRYGALTRAYLQGNEILGLDVDREALAEAAKLGIETTQASTWSSRASCWSTCAIPRRSSERCAAC